MVEQQEPTSFLETLGLTPSQLLWSLLLFPVALLFSLVSVAAGAPFGSSRLWLPVCTGRRQLLGRARSICTPHPEVHLHLGWLGLPYAIGLVCFELVLLPLSLVVHVLRRISGRPWLGT